ncbi:MAG TPA: hypothetical protein VJ549_00590 [Geothrix sp.]|nr:hypothetical protein [Geothrix sp.]HJV47745.1 hypothetical protein [Geothrix sp.]
MRLREKEAFHRHQTGVLTMEDVARERKAREAQERKAEERRQREAKAATRGPALLGVADAE